MRQLQLEEAGYSFLLLKKDPSLSEGNLDEKFIIFVLVLLVAIDILKRTMSSKKLMY